MQVEERKMKPVELLDVMHPQQFVMISKNYSDGISLRKDGPQITKETLSYCKYDDERSYRTEATFTPKLVPKHFVTTLIVGDELTYYESILLERRTMLKKFSETTNIFLPKEVKHIYYSGLLFDPNATTRNYIAGVELYPVQKCIVMKEINHVEMSDSVECVSKKAVNGDMNGYEQLTNGKM